MAITIDGSLGLSGYDGANTSPTYKGTDPDTGISFPGAGIVSVVNNGVETSRHHASGGFSVGTQADPGVGSIYTTGNITAYYSSDRRLKENIRNIPDALNKVNSIGGKLFDWKDEVIQSRGGEDGYFVCKNDFGVVAQDVESVFPQAVRHRKDGMLAVDYEKLSALAFAAIVELKKEVDDLKLALRESQNK
jgi:hypothetical protein